MFPDGTQSGNNSKNFFFTNKNPKTMTQILIAIATMTTLFALFAGEFLYYQHAQSKKNRRA